MPHVHGIYLSKGNSKVKFPILSVGAAADCASRKWCPFDLANYKGAGRKQCYAQKTERVYPSVLASRRKNQSIIDSLTGDMLDTVAHDIAVKFHSMTKHKRKDRRIVRINEAGDLAKGNIAFVCAVIRECGKLGVKCYLYSKAPPLYRRLAQEAGATVLHSEHEFIAVPTVQAGQATGLNRCPGVCGPCVACPSGIKSWIVEH